MVLRYFTAFAAFAAALFAPVSSRAEVLPAGTPMELRLAVATGSRISHPGDPVEATVIAPVTMNHELAVPQGATVSGVVETVERVGLGIRHLRSGIKYRFTQLELPGGTKVPIQAVVEQVETAKERVNTQGEVTGIYPNASVSSTMSIYALPMLYADPDIAVPMLGIKLAIARSPDPEIFFPAGTEVVAELAEPATVPHSAAEAEPSLAPLSAAEAADAGQILAELPEQRTNRAHNRPSDLVNFIVLGRRDAVDRAFAATGWLGAQRSSIVPLCRVFLSMVERVGYGMAPMGNMFLNGKPAEAEFQKGLDTFSKRHHIRFWNTKESNAWIGAATEDVGYRVERMHLTHATDPAIDNERAKVVNDLVFTGCVSAGALMDRATSDLPDPSDASIQTDGKVAVLRIGPCEKPRKMPGLTAHAQVGRRSRPVQIMIAMRNDLIRTNPISLGYDTLKALQIVGGDSTGDVKATSARNGATSKQTATTERAERFSGVRWTRPSMVDLALHGK